MALHSRIRRINEELKSAIATIIMTDVKDPRLGEGLVTVNQVAVSKDLHSAQVWVSVYGTDEQAAAAIEGLNHSKGYIKRLLAERVVLKYIPDLTFRHDTSISHAARINEILKQIEKDKKSDE